MVKPQKSPRGLPGNREEALGLTPLKYLIPTQDVSILSSSYNLSLQNIRIVHLSTKTSTLQQVRRSLGSKDSYLEPIVSYMKELVQMEDTVSLDNIHFKDMFALGDVAATEQQRYTKPLKVASNAYISQEILDGILSAEQLSTAHKPQNNAKLVQDQSFSYLIDSYHEASVDDGQEEPALKKQKLSDQTLLDGTTILEPSEVGETKSSGLRVFVDPEKIKSQALKGLIGLINSIGLEDSEVGPESLGRYFISFNPENTSVASSNNEVIHILNDEVLLRIESYLEEFFSYGTKKSSTVSESAHSAETFDSRYLARIENLCVKSVKYAQSIDWISVITDPKISQNGLFELKLCRNALKSCSVILSIFLSGREEQILYLEDYLAPLIEFVCCVTEALFLAITSDTGLLEVADHSIFYFFEQDFSAFSNLLLQTLQKINRYINFEEYSPTKLGGQALNEYLITKLEYMCTSVLFAEEASSSSNFLSIANLLGASGIQSFKNCTMDILVSIFKSYSTQRTFILEEILNNFNTQKLNNNKAGSRQFRLGHRGISVQLFTILLLRLVQAYDLLGYSFAIPIWKNFIFKSSYQETFQTSMFITDPKTGKIKVSSKEKPALYQEISKFQKHINDEKESLNTICSQVASFLITKLCESPDAAHKFLIENFIEDLLCLVPLPEWAGAETMLLSLMNTLMFVFSSSKYTSVVETFSLEMIGLIGCKVLTLKKKNKYSAHDAEQKSPFLPTPNITLNSFKELAGHYEFCMKYIKDLSAENKFFESNYRFFVFKWIQMLESLKQNFILAFQSQNPLDEENAVEGDQFLEDLNVIKLQRDAEKRLGAFSPVFSLVKDTYTKYLSQITNGNFDFSNLNDLFATFSGENVTKNIDDNSLISYNNVLASQNLLNLYDNFLNLVLSSLNHSKIKSRTRAIKNLASIIKRDSSILLNSNIKRVLFERIQDKSPLVRDATVDLVCLYVLWNPKTVGNFHAAIVKRITDTSVAVQRRVLRLMTKIYEETPSTDIKVLMVVNLLKVTRHEDALIIDLAVKNLIDILFLSVHKELNKKDKNEFIVCSSVIENVDMLTRALGTNDKIWGLFEEFIQKFVLFNGNRGVNHRRKIEFSMKHDGMMEVLSVYIEKIIDYVIQNSGAQPAKSEVSLASIEGFMGLLSVFTKCDGGLVSQDQLMLLLPYLADDSSTSGAICFYTLQIFKNTLPRVASLRPSFIKASQLSLLKLLTKFNVKELNEAIPCIWALSEMSKDTTKISNACVSCLKLIKPFVEQANKNNIRSVDPKLIRLLYLIGSFGRYCNFEKNREVFVNFKIGLKEGESITSVLTKYVLIFCKDSVNNQIRRIAIRNLVQICGTHAKLFISDSVLKIIDKEFNKPNNLNIDIKEVIVQGFADFLVQEEQESLRRAGLGLSASTDTKLDVNVFHGTYSTKESDGICASVVQRYLDKVLKLCLYDDGQRSFVFVKFLEVAVKQGFANPRLCITTIIALEFSSNRYIRSIAADLHQELHSKHETLVESRYIEGLKTAAHKSSQENIANVRDINAFKEFYEVISNTRPSKRKFMTSLTKSFNINISKSSLVEARQYKRYVMFVISRLSKIELSTLEEYYLICQSIEKHLLKEGGTLRYQIDSLSKADHGNHESWKKFALLAQALNMLLKYKKFSCMVFNIPNSKLKDFNPSKVDQELKIAGKNHYPYKHFAFDYGQDSLLQDINTCRDICTNFAESLINEMTNDSDYDDGDDELDFIGYNNGTETEDLDLLELDSNSF